MQCKEKKQPGKKEVASSPSKREALMCVESRTYRTGKYQELCKASRKGSKSAKEKEEKEEKTQAKEGDRMGAFNVWCDTTGHLTRWSVWHCIRCHHQTKTGFQSRSEPQCDEQLLL